jgi:tartrate-resistant acid phosphatase type 5
MLNPMNHPQATLALLICSLSISAWALPGPAKTDTMQEVEAQSGMIIFAVIGDYGVAGQPEADVANMVKSWNPDFIVTTGDNNQSGKTHEMDDNIGQYYHEFIFNYTGNYGAGSTTRRFFPSIGNHDWAGDGVKSYLQYFNLRENQRYYDFLQGPVHFFMLDSDQKEPDGVTVRSEQANWLRKGLAASTSSYNVVVLHHPPYSSGWHGSTGYIQWPFKEWGADVILSGHDHLYERLSVNGLPFFVNGLGGDEIYRFESVLPESIVRFNLDHGAMRVEATERYMKFQMITRSGLLVDEHVISNSIPTVMSITKVQTSPTNSATLDFAVTFSEPVNGVDPSDFQLVSNNIAGASISSLSGTGSTYAISVSSGSGDGTLQLNLIDDDSITNEYGNKLGTAGAGNGTFISNDTYSIDKTAPSLISLARTGSSLTNASDVEFLATFSESVSGVDTTDFTPASSPESGDLITSVSNEGNTYRIVVNTGPSDHTVGLNFTDDDGIVDAAGNSLAGPGIGNGSVNGMETYLLDKTAPLVTSIIRAGADLTSAATTDFIVTFSESVIGVDATDFAISSTNLSGATVHSVSNVDPFYIVTVNTGTGAGTLRLDLSDDDSIIDLAGNTTGGAGMANGDFTSGESYRVDKGPPGVLAISRAGSSPTNLPTVDFHVIFTEPVTGVDGTDFKLTSEAIQNAQVLNVTGNGSAYTVSINTGTADGSIRLDLMDDDSILNYNGSPLAGPENETFLAGETFLIDRSVPLATSVIRGGPNPSGSSTIDYIVTFSESMVGVDTTDFVTVVNNGMQETSIRSVTSFDPFYIVTTGEIYNILKNSTNFTAPTMHAYLKNLLTNDNTPDMECSPVRGAIAYEIIIASDENFHQLVTSQVSNSPAFELSIPLAMDGQYYWRVRAYNKNLEPGKFSATQVFTLDTTPPPAPALLGPPNTLATSRRPLLQWEKLGSAVKYHVEIDDNPDFSSPVFTTTRPDASSKMPRLNKGTYYWRVRASDQAKNIGAWSVPFSFKIP